MGVTFERFAQLAESTLFGSRDIVVNEQGSTARLGNIVFSSGSDANKATMKAFREAMSRRFGVFGEQAFDTVLGNRQQLQKPLRSRDVYSVVSKISVLREKRFINELARQLDTSPKTRELSRETRIQIRELIIKSPLYQCDLRECSSPADIARMADKRIQMAIDFVKAQQALGLNIDTSSKAMGDRQQVDSEIPSHGATGLKNLKTIFRNSETSIEDLVKKGTLGVGMRINRSETNPVLFDKLKSNGVEPGFIYRNDWSLDDTRGMLVDHTSQKSLDALNALKLKYPALAQKCAGLPEREQIMLFGRMHPACMSAVADFVIEKSMSNPNSSIYKAFCRQYPSNSPEQWQIIGFDRIKRELFPQIRDRIMHVRPDDGAYKMSPIFKHFTDRHIVKLDYNESERVFTKKAASAGKFMRPERIKIGRPMGQIYRLLTATTADKSSAGAVTEALANDLTRIAGVPSQELIIVRGQYSDGHPKLMLQAKYAEGYKDMENGYLRDGQIVPPDGEKVESLGRYKAFFLVTADRDAVGFRGQNKGFVKGLDNMPGTFFAIDPGHSLEGNSRFLEVDDNFSFKDTYGFSIKPRFKNFSVFDDDTRFAKFQGALGLRTLQQSGKLEQLFAQYRTAFTLNDDTLSPEERQLRVLINADIDKKEAEFKDSLAKILKVADNQFKLYDDLATEGLAFQEKAIETIENLEKLTSPTTWVSPRGEVPLKHLAVIPETRVAWRAYVEGANLVYHCDQPLSELAKTQLRTFAASAGAQLEIDAEGCARLTIARAAADTAFTVFSEKNVASATHTEEAAARAMGGDGLAEARTVGTNANTAANRTAQEPVPPFVLPDTLDVHVGNDTLTFQRQHYEAMLKNTPQAERPRNLEELKNILAARIQRGRDILAAVYAGNGSRYAATTRNVACVTLALHAGTVKKGEINERGAFSVADPDGKLYHWLDTCKELYIRTSSHAEAYHHQIVDGHMNMPRGLDIPEGMGGLMGGMRTLHYFTLPETGGQPRRLYLKCETYGIFRSSISTEEEESSRAPGMQTRQKRTGDTRESIKHCMSLSTVFTRRGNNAGNRKETTPGVILNAVEDAQRTLRMAGMNDQATILGQNVKGGGIRYLLNNLITVLEAVPDSAQAREVADRLTDVIAEYANSGQRSGEAANRMGNEVMLEPEEIL
ncbi:MAG: hypothetical protein K6G15_06775 [Desulfovibrio sp.]|nr:hypothetical protein [Desulfovibrio sp.]